MSGGPGPEEGDRADRVGVVDRRDHRRHGATRTTGHRRAHTVRRRTDRSLSEAGGGGSPRSTRWCTVFPTPRRCRHHRSPLTTVAGTPPQCRPIAVNAIGVEYPAEVLHPPPSTLEKFVVYAGRRRRRGRGKVRAAPTGQPC